MELNVEIDAIVLYGVERVDREQLAAQIAQRLSQHMLSPIGNAALGGASIGDRVADAVWSRLRHTAMEAG